MFARGHDCFRDAFQATSALGTFEAYFTSRFLLMEKIVLKNKETRYRTKIRIMGQDFRSPLFARKTDVRDWSESKKRDAREFKIHGVNQTIGKITFSAYLKIFLDDAKLKNLDPRTVTMNQDQEFTYSLHLKILL